SPNWSPDGQKFVYLDARGDLCPSGIQDFCDSVAVMNADGSGQTLIASGYNLSGPVWSPSANKIVFSSTYVAGGPSDYGYHNLYTIDLGTGAIVHLTHASVADYNPEWSPDGGWIAFDRQTDYRPGDEGPCCPEVFVMKADG